MKNIASITLACAAALCLPVAAVAQSASASMTTAKADGLRIKGGEVQVRAKVVELDQAQRIAVLRGPKGQLVTVNVPAEVKNFDQVHVGDELVIRYLAAIAAKIEPTANKSGIRERVESTAAASAPAGGMPGSAAARSVEVLAIIQAIDRKAGTATLRGVRRTVTVVVPAGVDISKLKVGDEVRAVFAEAVVLNVEHAPKTK